MSGDEFVEDIIEIYSDDYSDDDAFDFEDVDCESCGIKFFIRPSLYTKEAQKQRVDNGLAPREFPTKCERCRKGLPPLYEY